MYDWSRPAGWPRTRTPRFQLLLKGCTIEAYLFRYRLIRIRIVSVVVERMYDWSQFSQPKNREPRKVSVVVERMYDWSLGSEKINERSASSFSCCWKDVRLKLELGQFSVSKLDVSVVVERMYDWSCLIDSLPASRTRFSCCWKDVRLKLWSWFLKVLTPRRFSCCWKDVRLKRWIDGNVIHLPARFSCCWKDVRLKQSPVRNSDSMRMFQLLLKGCTIEAWLDAIKMRRSSAVSVVVERMYDWSLNRVKLKNSVERCFSCCWKDVRLKRKEVMHDRKPRCFSCCWKDVRLKHHGRHKDHLEIAFQLLLKGCTIEATRCFFAVASTYWFQLLLKGCTIEAVQHTAWRSLPNVSVVVERMYDWSSETNWLKTNDFWQLVSDLFFENGRSAQKVPLFSKIWGDLGDCLTVFDSCSNI